MNFFFSLNNEVNVDSCDILQVMNDNNLVLILVGYRANLSVERTGIISNLNAKEE